MQAQAKDTSAIDTIKQLEQDMGNAMVAGDIDKLNQIYADDFAAVETSGKIATKEGILSNFKSSHDKLESFELGPVDVQVFGDVAVACSTVRKSGPGTEKIPAVSLFEWIFSRSAKANG
jgi:ketosteroid isomerase-like protein